MKKKTASTSKRKSSPAVFDPFDNRLARDIRNTLSDAFVEAVANSDKSDYQNIARKWLAGNLDAIYADYIENRLERYEQVFEKIISNGIDDAKIQMLVFWNQGLFFEVHDHLERLWQQNTGHRLLRCRTPSERWRTHWRTSVRH